MQKRKKMKNRALGLIFAITAVLSMSPVAAFADDNRERNAAGSRTCDAERCAAEMSSMTDGGVELYSVDSPVTFLNSGYPYGKDMNNSTITLVIEADGEVTSYQWQMADSRDGSFTDISGATADTYTFTPASGKWYRCLADGAVSEAVMAVYPGRDGRTWTGPYSSWYIGNGSMAYMVNGSSFDAVGLYTRNGTEYMLQTSYSRSWQLFSSTSAAPEAISYGTSASLDALRVSFDARDDYNIFFEADLADGQQAFAFGCDTQLGDNRTSGSYCDSAALNAMVKGGVLQQIAMIGAATVEGAADSDAAFVIAPVSPASRFWIGHYSSRMLYAYNTSQGSACEIIDGQSVTTLVENTDSGMTMSWMNIPSGGSVGFRFSVGDVAHTGAVSGKVDYAKEVLTGLEAGVIYSITAGDSTYTITADENGEIPLAGTDNDGNSYDFAGKRLTIAKQGSEDTPAEVEVVDRPTTPDKPSDLEGEEGGATTPSVDASIEIVELTLNSVIVAPKEGQQYAYSTDDGASWIMLNSVDENGYYVIDGLPEGSRIYIRTRIAATSAAPASQWSVPTAVQLKQTVAVEVTGWEGTYDGNKHNISLNVTSSAENITVTYSSAADGGYSESNPLFTEAGMHTVYYRAVADGYYPTYGTATVNIHKKQVTVESIMVDLNHVIQEVMFSGLIEGEQFIKDVDFSATNLNITSGNTQLTASVTVTLKNTDAAKNYVITNANASGVPVIMHTHAWNYGVDDNSANTIYAYCSEADKSEYCPYYGAEKAVTLTLTALDRTYSGLPYGGASVSDGISAVSGAVAAQVKYYKTETAGAVMGGTLLSFAPTDAGHYYAGVTLSVNVDETYTAVSAFEIEPKNVSVTAVNQSVKKGNSIQTGITCVTVEGLNAGHSLAAVTLEGDTTKPTISGRVTPSQARIVDGSSNDVTDNYRIQYGDGTLTVTRADNMVTVTLEGWTYGDTANVPTVTATSKPGSDKIAYFYRPAASIRDEDWTATVPGDAGIYTVKAVVTGDDDYEDGSATADFTIRRVELTVTPDANQSKVYGEGDAALTYTVSGLVNGDTAARALTGALERAEGENVGEYVIRRGTLDAVNYNITVAEGVKFTITAKSLENAVITLSPGTKVYSGEDFTQSITGVLLGGTELTAADYVIDSNSEFTKKAYGTYTIRINGIGNYQGSATVQWSITKEKLTGIFAQDVENVVYDGTPRTITVIGVDDTMTVTYSTGRDGIFTTVKPEFTNAGEYTVYYKVYKNDNYELFEGSAKVTIDKADLTLAAKTAQSVYGTSVAALDYEVAGGTIYSQGGIKDDLRISVSTTVKEWYNAGVYQDAVTIAYDTRNYNVTIIPADYTVTRRTLIITPAAGQKKVYGEEDTALAYTADNLVPGDSLSGSLARAEGETVGAYAYSLGTLANDNYNIFLDKDADTFEITAKPLDSSMVYVGMEPDGSVSVVVKDSVFGKTVTLEEEADYTATITAENGGYEVTVEGVGNYRNPENAVISKKLASPSRNGSIASTVVVDPSVEDVKPVLEEVAQEDAKKLLVIRIEAGRENATAEEKAKIDRAIAAIEDGAGVDYNALLYLEMKDAAEMVTDEVEEEVIGIMEADAQIDSNATVGMYLDLSLFMTYCVTNGDDVIVTGTEKITDTSDAALGNGQGFLQIIKLTVPAELRPENDNIRRSYYVIRVHEDADGNRVFEVLQTEQNGYELTFRTDKFSIYALVYSDEPDETKISAETLKKNALELNAGLMVSQTEGQINVQWGMVSGADGYKVYAAYCGTKFTEQSITRIEGENTTNATIEKINGKELNPKKYYKIRVVAYKLVDGEQITLGKSLIAHIVGDRNTRYSNVASIQLVKSSYTLKEGTTATIKAKCILESPDKKQLSDHHAGEFRYATTDKKVAKVSAKGEIKAVGKGTCTIYVFARNGCAKKIKVKVK